MRAVNLLAYDAGLESSRRSIGLPKQLLPVAAVGVSTLLCAGIAWTYTGASADVSSGLDELAAVRAEQAALAAKAQHANVDALVERRLRESALATALSYRIAWDRLLGDVGYVLPRDVWVTSLHVQTPSSAVPAAAGEAAPTDSGAAPEQGPQTFTMTGYATSQASVARTLERLALVPGLTDVDLQSSSKGSVLNRSTVTFTIVGNVRAKGAE